ncbi:MAG: TRC40/GET3/ArsA family transport-energizing ATPase [Acidobacteriota bacterium]|nr:TRC40/GET3/ArsA family transport-energizing ATPase [Acidobacteriota bacterium]
MTRVILIAGKGGVGKTTVAASTGLASARRGHRTLVLSFDLAHSLSDSFDLDEALFAEGTGEPRQVQPNLWIQEIDVQSELQRNWQDLFKLTAAVMVGGGLEQALAEEVAIVPGMEDVVALLRLNEHINAGTYDVIVLDSPPTGEAIRFVSITSSLEWYVRKRLNIDRKITSLLRPMASFLGESSQLIPDDSWFKSVLKLFQALEGVDKLLRDPKVTTVRLVTNPEKMVVRETQRAYMYFSLYGMTIDSVVINRLLPQDDPFFAEWAKTQVKFSQVITDYFAPVPVTALPFFSKEVVGLRQLKAFSQMLFDSTDPAAIHVNAPGYGLKKTGENEYQLEILAPRVPEDKIDIRRKQEDLVVSIGMFRRNILLPRKLVALRTAGAEITGDKLIITFKGGNDA